MTHLREWNAVLLPMLVVVCVRSIPTLRRREMLGEILLKYNKTRHLNAKLSACFLVPINWTMAKNCCKPSYFSCFSSTSIKWWPKHDCIITQSTAPGRAISVAKKTISSPNEGKENDTVAEKTENL